MTFIGYLRGLSLGYAISSENSKFETAHVQDVAYYSEKLAFERCLDQNVALAIAYGHDLGRTKLGVNGKEHARVSARFMKALMAASDFEEQTQSLITTAIKRHNKKAKCHGVYDELIKDADALAHQDEGLIDESNQVEVYRATISSLLELSVVVAPLEAWCDQYESHRATFLHNLMHIDLFKEDSRQWIHEQRKNVRKLRSIIWYLNSGDQFDALDGLLKDFFGDLSEARMCQVQIDYLKSMPSIQNTLTLEEMVQTFEDRLSLSIALIESRLTNGHYNALIDAINHTIDIDAKKFDDPVKNQDRWLSAFAAYVAKAAETDPKKLKALHKMRIRGKNFKYMMNLELIQFSSQTIETVIGHLHDQIGILNDLGDIKKMKQWQSFYEASKVDSEIDSIQKLCKNTLFFFVKLDQMITNRHLKLS